MVFDDKDCDRAEHALNRAYFLFMNSGRLNSSNLSIAKGVLSRAILQRMGEGEGDEFRLATFAVELVRQIPKRSSRARFAACSRYAGNVSICFTVATCTEDLTHHASRCTKSFGIAEPLAQALDLILRVFGARSVL